MNQEKRGQGLVVSSSGGHLLRPLSDGGAQKATGVLARTRGGLESSVYYEARYRAWQRG